MILPTTNRILIIQLSQHLIKSLVSQQKKAHRSKLKVQFSSELIEKLVRTIPPISNHPDQSDNSAVHARVEVKKTRVSPPIRHYIQMDEKKKNSSQVRRRKRHIHRWKSSSGEENISQTDSISHLTQVQDTQTSSIEHMAIRINEEKHRH